MKASWTVACGVPPWMLSPPGRLTKAQRELAVQLGTDPDRPWHRFDPDSAEGRLCGEVARPAAAAFTSCLLDTRARGGLRPDAVRQRVHPGRARRRAPRPDQGGTRHRSARRHRQPGRQLLDEHGGWINMVGVWSPSERTDWFADERESALR